MEKTIRDFLVFMDKHDQADLIYDNKTAFLSTRGCDDSFGSCCAEHFDVGDLLSALRELVGNTH